MSFTFTIYVWWLWPYLLIGAVLWLPLMWLGWRGIGEPKRPFLAALAHDCRRHGWSTLWRIPFMVAAWPAMIWEQFR